MPVPSPRNKILPARGNFADLSANVASLLDGEICYAIDQDQYYQNEGGTLVSVGATKAQGALADTAVQPGDNVSDLTNDAGYITLAEVPGDLVTSVNTQTGDVVLDADDIDDSATTHKFATAAQLGLADTSVQPGDDVSDLTNDAGYITSAGAPVQSVAGRTGDVVLTSTDVGLGNVDNTSDANKPISTATQGALDLKADLVGGVIPTSQIPAIAITEFLGSVDTETEMLALVGQPGDWCLRTDVAVGYVIVSDDPSVVAGWEAFTVPGSAVTSINDQVGTVVLGAADVGAVQRIGDNMSGNLTLGDGVTDQITLNATDGSAYFASDVGIGTDAPGALLDLKSAASASLRVRNTANSSPSAPHIELLNDDNKGLDIEINRSGSDSRAKFVADTAISVETNGSERMRVDSAGNVGIGNIAPGAKLQIEGTSDQLKLTHTSIASYIHEVHSNGDYSISKDAVERLRVDSAGNVGIGTSSPGQLIQIGEGDTGVGTNVHSIARIEGRAVGGGEQVATLEFNQITNAPSEFVGASIGIESSAGTRSESELVFKVSQGTNTDATEAMRLSHDGRLGIGTASPNGLLTVRPASGNAQVFVRTNDTTSRSQLIFGDSADANTGGVQYDHSTDKLEFHVGNLGEKAALDSSGRLLIGLSSDVSGSADNLLQLMTEGGARVVLGRDDASISSGNTVGDIQFYGNDAGTQTRVGFVRCSAGASYTATSKPTALLFGTTASDSTDATERMRIDQDGNVGIGDASPDQLLHITGTNPTIQIESNGGVGDTARLLFRVADTGGTVRNMAQIDGLGTGSNAGALRFFARISGNLTEAARIDSSGNLGINTDNPSNLLDVASANGDGIRIGASTAGTITRETEGLRITGASTNKVISFVTAGSEAMRLDTSGRLLVGTSSAVADASSLLQISSAGGPKLALNLQDGTVTSGQFAASIDFYSFGGFVNESIASIQASADGAHASGDKPGRLVFSTTADGASSPTERMRIDSSGRLGVGLTPSADASITNVSAGLIQTNGNIDIRYPGTNSDPNGTRYLNFVNTDSTLVAGQPMGGIQWIGNDSNNPNQETASIRAFASSNTGLASDLTFRTKEIERMRIDSAGSLLVNTSSARTNYSNGSAYGPLLSLEGTSNSNRVLSFIHNDSSGGPFLVLGCTGGSSAGSNDLVAAQSTLGFLSWQGADGSELVQAASIKAQVDGTPGSNDMPGRLVFSTTADGASSPTERMTIDNSGVHRMFGATGVCYARSAAGAGVAERFFIGYHSATDITSGGTISYNVFTNGNVTNANNSYTGISDIKLKENIVDANSQWDDLKALRVVNYNFKPETGAETFKQLGLIAQEVELVSPGLVGESPDRDEDGNDLGTATKSVNYSVLYMKAVKALQEAMERIETLEQRLSDAGIA